MREGCPFCRKVRERGVIASNPAAAAVPDGFPVSPGHTLVVPLRHVEDIFDLLPAEQEEVWRLVATVRAKLLESHHPDGLNVGINAGAAAGQTVMHAHVHVIPRYAGDVADPRGGVRWVVPGRAAYWRTGGDT